MSEIRIKISVGGSAPNQDRLARADRYVERANQSIDRRDREAYAAEADRIYREELGR